MIADKFGSKSSTIRIAGRSCNGTQLPTTNVSTPLISWIACRKRLHMLANGRVLEDTTISRTAPKFNGRRFIGFPARSCVGCPRTVIMPPAWLDPTTIKWSSVVILECSSDVPAIPGRLCNDEGSVRRALTQNKRMSHAST